MTPPLDDWESSLYRNLRPLLSSAHIIFPKMTLKATAPDEKHPQKKLLSPLKKEGR